MSVLLTADADRVRTLTLHRPRQLNALDEALYDALTEALRAADADPEVAVVLLTGAGRAFCAGTDLVDLAARTTCWRPRPSTPPCWPGSRSPAWWPSSRR